MACVYTNPLEINLVLDIRHENESGDNTLALRCAQLGADLAVPNVVGRGQKCSDCALCHGQEGGFLLGLGVCVDGGHALRLPVDLGCISQVLVDGLHIVQAV